MKGFEKDEKAVEEVRKHYKCNSKYLCPNFHDCWVGDGFSFIFKREKKDA